MSTPAGRIIAMFGGQTALARHLRLAQSTVQGWEMRGYFPIKRIPKIRALAREKLGHDIPADDFIPDDAA